MLLRKDFCFAIRFLCFKFSSLISFLTAFFCVYWLYLYVQIRSPLISSLYKICCFLYFKKLFKSIFLKLSLWFTINILNVQHKDQNTFNKYIKITFLCLSVITNYSFIYRMSISIDLSLFLCYHIGKKELQTQSSINTGFLLTYIVAFTRVFFFFIWLWVIL